MYKVPRGATILQRAKQKVELKVKEWFCFEHSPKVGKKTEINPHGEENLI